MSPRDLTLNRPALPRLVSLSPCCSTYVHNCDSALYTTTEYTNDWIVFHRYDNHEWRCSAGDNTTSCCPKGTNCLRISGIAQIQNGSAFMTRYTISPIASESLPSSMGNDPSPTRSPGTARWRKWRVVVLDGFSVHCKIVTAFPSYILLLPLFSFFAIDKMT